MKDKFLYLESLRGIAALFVVMHHSSPISYSSILGNNPFFVNGDFLVDFFFVLSGFVIAFSYSDRITDGASISRFTKKRFFRLYPLHFLTLLLFVLIAFIQHTASSRYGVGDPASSSPDNLKSFFSNLFLIHSVTEDELTFNGPSWSISVEFIMYAYFGLVTLFCSRRTVIVICIATILLSTIPLLVHSERTGVMQTAMYRGSYAFPLGMLLYYFYNWRKIAVANWLVYYCLALALVSIWFGKVIQPVIPPLVFGLLILSLLYSNENRLKTWLVRPTLVYLGTISYGIYMIHVAVWWFMNQGIRFGLGTGTRLDTRSGQTILDLGPVEGFFWVVVGLTITVAAASFSYRYIERPFMRR
ncbi:MAG: acyltransferase [Granulosicoccus sp.]